jgi:hypothetical protein
MSHGLLCTRSLLLGILFAGLSVGSTRLLLADDDVKPVEKVEKFKKGKGKPVELKKYEDVITAKAKSTPGVFSVHRIDDRVYFEVPRTALGKLMLWTTEVAKAPAGVAWGGSSLGNRVVRWERRGNKVLLWQAIFEKRSDGKAIQRAVDSANLGSIIMGFNVEAEGKDKSAVIDVTSLFTSDVPEFSARRLVTGASGVDGSRSYIEEIKSFPTNIETRSLLTFKMGGGGPAGAGKSGVPRPATGSMASVSMLVHYSMTLLPDRPMRGRFFDPRVGYFTRSFEDYSSSKHWVVKNKYIARFRLEKKDPEAAVSEPVKPIVFYISREVPEKWRPYMRKGIEDWRPAFEAAGFKNAIEARDAPSIEEDPAWDPEDARYSVIRWVAVPIQNAMGPHVHDPRSGEVMSAHIIMWHDILKLVQQWYFVQCAAVDPRARRLPLPDDLIGELLRYVVAHEVGHTLGLRHNHRASSAFSVAQLRNPEHAKKFGTVASIMSYGRFNYVAQPEDKVTALIPRIAPYDVFAIAWGYKTIAAADSADAERPELDRWAARQMKEPWLRFGGEDGPAAVDPTVKTENIGDDTLQATALGLKNLDRVVGILVPATTRLGEDYTLLEETYKNILSHRARWFGAVAQLVGGVVETRSLGGRGSDSFQRVARDKQQEAVKFLIEHAFTTPKKLLQPDLVNRFAYFGVADQVMNQQKTLLQTLLSARRFKLLMDAEVLGADEAYSAMQFLSDVQDGVWRELGASQPLVDVCRRQLQRSYLEHIKSELNPKEPVIPTVRPRLPDDDDSTRVLRATNAGTDFRAVARAALRNLAERIDSALARTQDTMTRVHLQDCRREVELILNPKG